jgi:hypothetical protein
MREAKSPWRPIEQLELVMRLLRRLSGFAARAIIGASEPT